MKRKSFVVCAWASVALILLAAKGTAADRLDAAASGKKTAVMTYATTGEQVRAVKALIKSVRDLSGKYRNSRIYVVLGDPENVRGDGLQEENVELLPLEMDRSFLEYPLAIKAFAAAQVERAVQSDAGTLVWIDPGVIVLGSLAALDLEGKFAAALRPVTLANTIGIPPRAAPNDYWEPIYKETGCDYRNLPEIETVVDEVKIQPYYNCEVFAVDPKRGICAEWARVLASRLQDDAYQKNACTTFLRRLFLHQTVLSGVIGAKVSAPEIKPLPLSSGYPFSQQQRLPQQKRIASLNDLSVVIFDTTWDSQPSWMDEMEIREPLKGWLFDVYLDYLKLNDSLYRIEGSCNSYLVATHAGSVLIDPAGASVAPRFFQRVAADHPLKAILLTHAHQDHSDGIERWTAGAGVPVIAQRQYKEYFQYQAELAKFFARRNAIWSGKPIPANPPAPSPANPPAPNPMRGEPTLFFADEHQFELGGLHFKMIHTPGETPDHTTIWIPELKAVFVGDNYYEYFINNSTFRGTMIRPVKEYIHALDTALSLEPEYFLQGHGAAICGKERIRKTVGDFRDALKYVYNETVKGINEGKDVYTLMQEIKLPPRYRIGQYYGKVEWTVRGIWQEYVGWFDENPATMYALPAASIYADLVEMAGSAAIVKKAEEYFAQAEYVKVLHLTDVILRGDPNHKPANEIRLKALKSLKAGTRNFIEGIWLDFPMRTAEGRIKNSD